MTRKARALGMKDTVFRNASGLPDKEQVTTARDLAVLGRAIQDRFPRLYRFFSMKTFLWRGTQIANHNRLINRAGVDGIKTGYTRASGFNLVTSVKLNNRAIVAVVLGGASAGARDERMRDLIDEYLPKAYAGERTSPLVAEAPPAVRHGSRIASAPLPPPVPGSREPIRPNAGPHGHRSQGLASRSPRPRRNPARSAYCEFRRSPSTGMAPLQPLQITSYAAGSIDVSPATSASAAPMAQALPAPHQPARDRGPRAGCIRAAARFRTALPPAVAAAPPATPRKDQTPAIPALLPCRCRRSLRSRRSRRPRNAAASRPGWHIQIGAYTDEGEAKGHLPPPARDSRGLLAKAKSYTEKTIKGSVEYVRARFAGFSDEADARKACEALKKNDFTCIPVRN